jgi:hypothetical protein
MVDEAGRFNGKAFHVTLNFSLILNVCTQTGPYRDICFQIMKDECGVNIDENDKNAPSNPEINISDIFKALDSSSFIKRIPPFLNQRATHASIKLIKAVILIGHDKLLPYGLMAQAIIAF